MWLKNINLGPQSITANSWSAGQRNFQKKTPNLDWVGIWARDTVMRHWSADTLFWHLSIYHNMDVYQVKLLHQLGNLTFHIGCHVVRAYGYVITKKLITEMDRLPF